MKKSINWIAAAVIIVIIFGTIYGTVQQAQRNDADMPQIQLALDTAAKISQNTDPNSIATGKVDLSASLQPFVIIYDKSGKPISGNGYLDNAIPTVPFGVLQAAEGKPYHTVTWQPQSGVRIAAIAVAEGNYFVLSGRSLLIVEQNEQKTMLISALGCLVSLAVLVLAYFVTRKSAPKNRKA